MKKEKIAITTTKRGFPAMWESGGGMTSGGSATIIAGRNGEACRPVFMPRGGHLACGEHALICVHEGYYIVHTRVSHGERSSATIQRIVATSVKDIDGEKWEAFAEVEEINVFSLGEWDTPLDEKFVKAVEAGFSKAGSYHCRSAYFVDMSEKKNDISETEKKRREEEMRRQDKDRANLRQAKADREAKAKAEAEEASKIAKKSGLGAKLEALKERLLRIQERNTGTKYPELVLEEIYFKFGWNTVLYTEDSIQNVENNICRWEAELDKKDSDLAVLDAFRPKFEVFRSRVETLGFEISYFTDSQRARLTKGCCTVSGSGEFSFSEEGLISFNSYIEKKEEEILREKKKAEAYTVYLRQKAEASVLGLPTNIRIWKRRGGATNAGDGWVIRPDGTFREPDKMECPRSRYSDEGYQNWEQVLIGEVVLQWSKGCSAGDHHFEVIYQPETLTSAQLEKIAMLEEEIAIEWDGRVGLASGIPSPPVGDGWGLTEKKFRAQKMNYEQEEDDLETETEVEEEYDREITLEDLKKLQKKFGK